MGLRIRLFVVCLAMQQLLVAQVFDSEKEAMDPRLSELPYYSYSKGIGLTTPDSSYSMNIRFRMQARAAQTFRNADFVSAQWAIRRLRLRFDGFAFSPRITYTIQLSFATEDNSGEVGTNNVNIIRDAIVFYRANNHLTLGFGQTKLPGNRQRVNSSSALQMVDRSITNAAFTIDRDFGFFGTYRMLQQNGFGAIGRAAISTGKGRNWRSFSTPGLAWTGRLELYPLGDFTNNGVFFEGDLEREQSAKVMLGFTYHYNHKSLRSQGELGPLLGAPRNLSSGFADFLLKYRGWAFMADYMWRGAMDPITYTADSSLVPVLVGQGMNLQGSYLFANNYEVVVRYATVETSQAIGTYTPSVQEMRIGINKYIRGHSLKLQLDGGLTNTQLLGMPNDQTWNVRFQIELGI